MNEQEILKAAEYCINCNGRKCEGCSFGRNRSGNCGWYFAKAIVANAIAKKIRQRKRACTCGNRYRLKRK